MRATNYGAVIVRSEKREHYVNVVVKADARVLISLDLVANGDPDHFSLDTDGSVITLDAENGMLKYEVVGWDALASALVCDLIFSTVEGIEV